MRTLLLAFILSTSSVHANSTIGGSDAVFIKGKPFLLDFVEEGVEMAPVFSDTEPNLLIYNKLFEIFDPKQVPVSLLGKKITEIYNLNARFAALILSALEMYHWSFVSTELISTYDENTTLNTWHRQVAIRKTSKIMIDRNLWSQLDPANQVGIIIHEALFSFMDGVQYGIEPRNVNGYLFSENLQKEGLEGARLIMGNEFRFLAEAISHKNKGTQLYKYNRVSYSFGGQIKIRVFLQSNSSQRFTKKDLVLSKSDSENNKSFLEHCQNPNRYVSETPTIVPLLRERSIQMQKSADSAFITFKRSNGEIITKGSVDFMDEKQCVEDLKRIALEMKNLVDY